MNRTRASLLVSLSIPYVLSAAWAESWTLDGDGKPIELNIGFKASNSAVAMLKPASVGEVASIVVPDVAKDGLLKTTLYRESQDRSGLLYSPQAQKSPPVIFVRNEDVKARMGLHETTPFCTTPTRLRSRGQAWDVAYDCLRQQAKQDYLGLSAVPDYSLFVIEPVFDGHTKHDKKMAEYLENRQRKMAQASANETPASRVWPTGQPNWHLDDAFSQLASAGQKVPNVSGVLVAHLDTGYLPNASSLPENFDASLSVSCLNDVCDPDIGNGVDTYVSGFLKSPGHGPATLSNLATAAPKARVFSVRIGSSVVHLDSRAMGKGIEAAVAKGADVITMSHGGLPSSRLIAAVNYAYENGTAIFAATGDYFDSPFGALTFKQVAYPARFDRVMGVAGATHDKESYGDDPSWKWLFSFGPGYFGRLGDWSLRGNYGPSDVMADHIVTAYAPNITRATPTPSSPAHLGHDGGGTSHATPQVAAAATYWLAANKSAIGSSWRDWKKTEAVYVALSKSADTCFVDYNVEHYGVGLLRANAALDYSFSGNNLVRNNGSEEQRIPLEERPKANWDYRGVIELARSTDLFKMFNGGVADAAIEALNTELMQLALGSRRLQELLQASHICKPVNGCDICTREDVKIDITKLAKTIRRSPDASETLKGIITEISKKQPELIVKVSAS